MIKRATCFALVLVLLISGCGDDETEGPTSSSASTETTAEGGSEEFDTEIQRLCDQVKTDLTTTLVPYAEKFAPPEEFAANEKLVAKVADTLEAEMLPAFRSFIDKTRALEPPPEDAEAFEEVMDAYEEAYEGYEVNPISMIDPDADSAVVDAEERTGYSLPCE